MQTETKQTFPAQHQNRQPGHEAEMWPAPQYDDPAYKASGKLAGKKALITGGDSGIGRAVGLAYAKEGADVAILHLHENDDAGKTVAAIQGTGRKGIPIAADLRDARAAREAAEQAARELGGIDILVNNAGAQYPRNSLLDITEDQLHHTFESNIFSMFYVTQAVLPHLKSGGAIVNTASITAFQGNAELIDYSASKGAVVSFTRSMALSLMAQNIRVNAVAPGPVWTPLIVSSFSPETVSTFGSNAPMHRAAQPCELAPVYVFLACADSNFVTGQIFHVNGGTVIN